MHVCGLLKIFTPVSIHNKLHEADYNVVFDRPTRQIGETSSELG